MTPIFERASGLAAQAAAQAQAEPTSFVAASDAASASAVAAAPQVSNTFNVRIALTGGTAGAAEQRRIEAILADLLRDSARRQGLFE